MLELTEKQREIYLFIYTFIASKKYPPTIREVGNKFKMSSKGAYDHIKAIENKGYINRKEKTSRAIRCNVRIPE